MINCYCGKKQAYSNCCEPYIKGEKFAPTPEALMRSRYSAFVQANMDYIVATMKDKVAKDFDPASAKVWAAQSKWLGLEIVNTSELSENNQKGFVEFIARYQLQNQDHAIHERSEFQLENGRWYYVNGKFLDVPTQLQKVTKIGRNDPCSCGSGKKYKKCCA